MARSLLVYFGLCVCSTLAYGGKYNPVLSVGDLAPVWENLEGTDGKRHGSDEWKGLDAVVVVFTCNSCPVAVGYEDRIIALAKKYSETDARVRFVAINVNTTREDSLPAMTRRSEKKRFPFTYVIDPTQQIARKFGANYTPEFFLLDKNWRVAYLGAMDDKSPPQSASTQYLEDAIGAVLKGKSVESNETLARGCRIRFNRKTDD